MVSAIYKCPSWSTAIAVGKFKSAFSAGPPSPVNRLATPIPFTTSRTVPLRSACWAKALSAVTVPSLKGSSTERVACSAPLPWADGSANPPATVWMVPLTRSTLRMTWFSESAISTFPWPSRHRFFGSFREAARARPPSPENPGVPLPATLRIVPRRVSMFTASSKTSHDGITHLGGSNNAHAWTLDVLGPVAEIQRLDDRLLDQFRFLVEFEPKGQHHGC